MPEYFMGGKAGNVGMANIIFGDALERTTTMARSDAHITTPPRSSYALMT